MIRNTTLWWKILALVPWTGWLLLGAYPRTQSKDHLRVGQGFSDGHPYHIKVYENVANAQRFSLHDRFGMAPDHQAALGDSNSGMHLRSDPDSVARSREIGKGQKVAVSMQDGVESVRVKLRDQQRLDRLGYLENTRNILSGGWQIRNLQRCVPVCNRRGGQPAGY